MANPESRESIPSSERKITSRKERLDQTVQGLLMEFKSKLSSLDGFKNALEELGATPDKFLNPPRDLKPY